MMSAMTITSAPMARSRRPALDRTRTAELAATENARFVALVESLEPEHWAMPTDCPGWDVRAMVAHVVGAMEGQVSKREFVHQMRAGSAPPATARRSTASTRCRSASAPRWVRETSRCGSPTWLLARPPRAPDVRD